MSWLSRSLGLCIVLVLSASSGVSAATSSNASPATAPALDPHLPTLFIIGDSTVHNGTKGEQGWGDPIKSLFDRTRINVENHAMGGRSSRTFRTEGRWQKVLEAAKPGDFVLMQFGHNDAAPLSGDNRERGTIRGVGEETQEVTLTLKSGEKETVHSYGWYMKAYITEAVGKGLIPIVVSPIPHCPQKPAPNNDYTGPESGYVQWAGEVAKSQNAFFIDLNQIVRSHYNGLTPEQLKTQYFTSADNTHTNPAGATLNASSVVEGLRTLKDCPLVNYLIEKPAGN